jgi:hypothetical protein
MAMELAIGLDDIAFLVSSKPVPRAGKMQLGLKRMGG